MKRLLLRIVIPWSVTAVALYLAFREVDWQLLWTHLRGAEPILVAGAILLTGISYLLRAARWPLLFPSTFLPYLSSLRVLMLGFFMNNVLPARAGELVRAHLGGKVTGQPRTLVLATVASERLADGLTISIMFATIILVFGRGHLDPQYSQNLMYVAYLFMAAAAGVIVVISLRKTIFAYADRLATKLNHRASTYTLSRVQLFIEGLSPLSSPGRAAKIGLWSVAIWGVELGVFALVLRAFDSPLHLSGAVIFLAAVNFSSLVPAAPGGFGVIELVAKSVLMSLGVESRELALSMVLTQHVIQYGVVGIPGAFLLATLRAQLQGMTEAVEELDVQPTTAVGS